MSPVFSLVGRVIGGTGEVLCERSERGDAGWEHAERAGLRRRGAKPPKSRRVLLCIDFLSSWVRELGTVEIF